MKKILVTGSNGFVGQNIIETIDREEYEIYALDFAEHWNGSETLIKQYFQVDISKPFKMDYEFDIILHLAALNQTNINSDLSYEQYKAINEIGTKNLLESCKTRRMIYFSTANIYSKENRIIDENAIVNPKSYYELSKYNGELVCKKYMSKEKLVIVRSTNIAGVKQKNKALIPWCVSQAMKNEPINIFVPKNKKLQILAVEDVCRALNNIIEDASINGVYNIANNNEMKISELVEKIVELCHSQSQILYSNDTVENDYFLSSEKAKRNFQWESIVPIEKIIDKYIKKVIGE